MLFHVPVAKSLPRLPATVTTPDRSGCLNCRWLPRIQSRTYPSISSNRIASRTLGNRHARWAFLFVWPGHCNQTLETWIEVQTTLDHAATLTHDFAQATVSGSFEAGPPKLAGIVVIRSGVFGVVPAQGNPSKSALLRANLRASVANQAWRNTARRCRHDVEHLWDKTFSRGAAGKAEGALAAGNCP